MGGHLRCHRVLRSGTRSAIGLRSLLVAILLLGGLHQAALGASLLSSRPSVAVGDAPVAAVLADLDGDGVPDLAVGNAGTDDVSVMAGRGDGTFGPQQRHAAGDSPSSLAAADFNGDGRSDLAVANRDSDDLSILIAIAGGGFKPQVRLPVGDAPAFVVAADINADHLQDLVVVNETSRDLSVLLGAGDGTFSTQIRTELQAPSPISVAAATLDPFLHTGLIVAFRDGLVGVMIGLGDGTFFFNGFVLGGQYPVSLSTGDINADGLTDIVVAGRGSVDLTILLGRGSFSFLPEIHVPLGFFPASAAVGDFNADGQQDLAVVDVYDGVSILLGMGDAQFHPPIQYPAGEGPISALAGDMTLDGPSDLVVVNAGSDDVTVFVANPSHGLSFGPPSRVAAGPQPGPLAIADFDADGRPDLAVSSLSNGGIVRVARGLGGVAFAPPAPIIIGIGYSFVGVGNFNGDAFADLVVSGNAFSLASIFLGRAGDLLWPFSSFPAGVGPLGVAVSDFDGNGTDDIAVASAQSDEVAVLLGQGGGEFGEERRYPAHDFPRSVAVGDFNHDGLKDLVVANRFSSLTSILRGTGGGAFGPQSFVQAAARGLGVAVADFNGDGFDDVAETDDTAPRVAVLLGTSGGGFAPRALFQTGEGPGSLAIGDLNGDGRQDLVVANSSSGTVSVFLGVSVGLLGPQISFRVGGRPNTVAVEDIDLDGRTDIVVSTSSPDNVMILLNRTPSQNEPPVAVAGPDTHVECTSSAGATVRLDGSGSYDADSTAGTNDDIVSFEWFLEYGTGYDTLIGTGEVLEVTLPTGRYEITLVVTDSSYEAGTDAVEVVIRDTHPPTLSVTEAPSVLWPPNHRMVGIKADVSAADTCGAPFVLLSSLFSNEPDDANGSGDGATVDDIQEAELGNTDLEFLLRAERASGGVGRVYTATYVARDSSGNEARASVSMVVPKDMAGVTEPMLLSLEETDVGTVLRWDPVPGARSYRIVRGNLAGLHEEHGALLLGSVACVAGGIDRTDTLGHEDDLLPPSGAAFFYLGEYDDGGPSGYGTESAATETTVQSAPANCH